MFELAEVIIGGLLLLGSFLVRFSPNYEGFSFLGIMLISLAFIVLCFKPIYDGVKKLIEKDWFSRESLAAIAIVVALLAGQIEAISFAMFFYLINDFLIDFISGKNDNLFTQLDYFQEETATLYRDGKTEEVGVSTIKVGDQIVVEEGNVILLDGIVTEGTTTIDTSLLTGIESSEKVSVGDRVHSGSFVLEGSIRIEASGVSKNSLISQITDLLCDEESKDSSVTDFCKQFSKMFIYVMLGLAVLVAVIPSIITHDASRWLGIAATFILVSLATELLTVIPLSYAAGIGINSKKGIFVRGDGAMEDAAHAGTIIFNKDALLTNGEANEEFVDELKALKVSKLVMLTDAERADAKALAEELRIDEFGAGLSDVERQVAVEKYKDDIEKRKSLMAVSKGLSSRSVYASADVNAGLGALADGVSLRRMDIALMAEDPSLIASLIRIARRTDKLVKAELVLSIVLQVATLVLATLGLVGPWAAALAALPISITAIIGITIIDKQSD